MTTNNVFSKRNIDIVMCIDGTGSMTPCIDNVKDSAKRFYTDFARAMTQYGSSVNVLRIKLIVFRDYLSDGQESMVISPFFELPADEDNLSAYMSSIQAKGGCGEDANGLEALYYAMTSDFTTGSKDRQVIVLFADTTAIPMGMRRDCPEYPRDMVDEKGLLETWNCVQSHPSNLRDRNKRLVMFAPKGSCYEQMAQRYNRSAFTPVEIHNGLSDVSFDAIINMLAASASA